MLELLIVLSHCLAAASMICGAIYLYRKTRLLICTTSMLLALVLIFYGPAYLVYILHYNVNSGIYRQLAKSPYFDEAVVSLNVALAIMYLGCILGIEVADKLAAGRRGKLTLALEHWTKTPLTGNPRAASLLIALNLALSFFMLCISLYENHLGIVLGFLRATAAEKDHYRLLYAGSQFYSYQFLLTSIAPFFLMWGILEGWVGSSRPLMVVSVMMLAVTLFGRVETLSRAPVAFLILQLALAVMLRFQNRLTLRFAMFGSLVAIAIFLPLIKLTIPTLGARTALDFFFRRSFFVSDETLLEFFTAFPHYLSHTWGANMRPIAFLLGVQFHPAYADVAYLWRGERSSISNAMFIADAWVDFSFFGVALVSVVVGMVCRAIDLAVISEGKSAITVAVLACLFSGVLSLMIGSAPTAVFSGGLITVPLLALSISALTSRLRTSQDGSSLQARSS